jgi:dTDP-4-dehydrorhamnose 3,5-epimerase-like enzyme
MAFKSVQTPDVLKAYHFHIKLKISILKIQVISGLNKKNSVHVRQKSASLSEDLDPPCFLIAQV